MSEREIPSDCHFDEYGKNVYSDAQKAGIEMIKERNARHAVTLRGALEVDGPAHPVEFEPDPWPEAERETLPEAVEPEKDAELASETASE